MVALAAISVIVALAIVSVNTSRERSHRAACLNNLQQVGQALQKFSEDHNKTLPFIVADHPPEIWWWYKEQVKGYLGLKNESSANDTVFACPDDRGYSDPKPFCRNSRFDFSSYVFNGVTLPGAGAPNIAGWQTTAIKEPQRTLLVMEWAAHAPLSWHKSRTGKANAPFYCDAQCMLAFVDGHVNFTKMYYDGYNAAYTRDPVGNYPYKFSGN